MPFKAKYDSQCGSPDCKNMIDAGMDVTMIDTDLGRVTVHTACAEHEISYAEPVESDGADFDSFNRGRPPIPVLPRGKTGKDRCDKCFIVHAPGQNGCEY